MLDLANQPLAAPGGRVVRHFTNTTPEHPDFQDLPATRPGPVTDAALANREMLRQRLGLLLHLAAFYARWAGGDVPEFRQGLAQYARASTVTGWNPASNKYLENDRRSFERTDGDSRSALEYFVRVLFWAKSMFSNDGSGVSFSQDKTYAGIHNTMCSVEPDEIAVSPDEEPGKIENVVAHICRICVAALLRDEASLRGHNYRGHSFGKPLPLLTPKSGVELAPGTQNMLETLEKSAGDETSLRWEADYRQT